MTTQDTAFQTYETVAAPVQAAPARRLRGLRMPALPSWPLVAQLVGSAAALLGIYWEWGRAVTLIVGGVACVVLGALREAGKV